MEEIKVGKINIPIIKGEKGEQGLQGPAGKDGLNGYSPVKGKDYFTPDEIDEVTGEVTTRAKENLEYEFRENIKDISYNNTTGIMTFTRYDETTVDVDLPLELIVSSGTYNDLTKEIELTLANGQLIKIPLSDLIDDFYVKSEIDQKVDTINGEITNLKTEDSKLQEIIDNQSIEIGYLNKVKKQLLEDYKKIPFNSSSNHIEDTGELPILDFGINGGIEQDTREGYNHFDIQDIRYNQNCEIIEHTAQSITLRQKLMNVLSNIRLGYFNLKAGVTYTVIRFFEVLEGTKQEDTGYIEIFLGNTWKKVLLTGGKTKGTFTVDEDGTYTLMLKVSQLNVTEFTQKLTVKFYDVMVYEGTDDKPYEQYGAMPSLPFPSEVKGVSGHYDNVVENKNVFKFGNISVQPSGITVDKISEKRIKINGTTTSEGRILFLTSDKPIDKAMILSAKKISGSVSKNIALSIYEGLSSWNRLSTTADFKDTAITKLNDTGLKSSTYQIGIFIGTGVTFDNYEIEFQFEYGDTATEIVEHQEQNLPIDIPVGKVLYNPNCIVELTDEEIEESGLEKAELYFKDEYLKVVLDGTETITVANTGTENWYYNFNFSSNSKFPNGVQNSVDNAIFSNMYKNDTVTNSNTNKGISIYTTTMRIREDVEDTIDSFKARLKELYDNGTPLYVVYKLAKPIYTPIKDENFIKQYRALEKAHSYKEVTNINSYKSSEDVADMKVSGNALMSNDIRMSKIENAILSLGGNV